MAARPSATARSPMAKQSRCSPRTRPIPSFRLCASARQGGQSDEREVLQYVPTKPDSISEQMSQIEDVIIKKPDAIVFAPVDYKAWSPAMEKMNAAQNSRHQRH